MSLPRVYADFNAIEYLDAERSRAEIPLTGYGTLGSLARQGLRLVEGMALVLYEPSDIECEAIVGFDFSRRDPAGRSGEWVAKINPRSIKECVVSSLEPKSHPCISCGRDFESSPNHTKRYREVCTGCGSSVMEPMAPPQNAA